MEHRVPKEAGAAWTLPVVVSGKPLVLDIQLGDPPVALDVVLMVYSIPITS